MLVAAAAEKMRRVAPVVCDAILRAVVEGLEVEMAPWRRSRALETLRGVVKDAERLGGVYASAIGDEGEDARAKRATRTRLGMTTSTRTRTRTWHVRSARRRRFWTSRASSRGWFRRGRRRGRQRGGRYSRAVAGSFREKARGVDPVPANEDGAGHIAYAVFLAVDAVVATARSLETIADAAADESDEMESDRVARV